MSLQPASQSKMSGFNTPTDAEHAFYEAMSSADLDTMMTVWADGDEAVCVHPGGPRLVGTEAIRESFEEIFEGGAVHVERVGLRAYRHGDVAIHNLVEEISVTGRMGTQTVSVIATNVYVKSSRGWLMMLHHAATADGDEEDGTERPAGPLH
jgi:uncharacterized protein (TIGR02246 family)